MSILSASAIRLASSRIAALPSSTDARTAAMSRRTAVPADGSTQFLFARVLSARSAWLHWSPSDRTWYVSRLISDLSYAITRLPSPGPASADATATDRMRSDIVHPEASAADLNAAHSLSLNLTAHLRPLALPSCALPPFPTRV